MMSKNRMQKTKRWLIDCYKTIRLYQYYSPFKAGKTGDGRKLVVAMADGRMHHGGLSDRLSGIVSAYQYCQLNKVDFRIHFVSPFRLELLLEPNEYDWRISPEDISYSLYHSRPVFISMVNQDVSEQRYYANNRLKWKLDQTHLYSNMRYYKPEEFGRYFNKLFRMSPLLEKEINSNLTVLGKDYVSISFRFQQLLGDFKDAGYPVLHDERERDKLLEKCLQCIEKVHKKTNGRILVASDSMTFLQIAGQRYGYVYTIPGNVVHMDYAEGADKTEIQSHLKTLVDFFMLANAQCLYLATVKPLYHSFFPEMASWVYGKPFHQIS